MSSTSLKMSMLERNDTVTMVEAKRGYLFPVPSELVCTVCNQLMREAVLLKCCGTSFCGECIQTILTQGPNVTCPNRECNDTLAKNMIVNNRSVQKLIGTFKQKVDANEESMMKKLGTDLKQKSEMNTERKPLAEIVPKFTEQVAPKYQTSSTYYYPIQTTYQYPTQSNAYLPAAPALQYPVHATFQPPQLYQYRPKTNTFFPVQMTRQYPAQQVFQYPAQPNYEYPLQVVRQHSTKATSKSPTVETPRFVEQTTFKPPSQTAFKLQKDATLQSSANAEPKPAIPSESKTGLALKKKSKEESTAEKPVVKTNDMATRVFNTFNPMVDTDLTALKNRFGAVQQPMLPSAQVAASSKLVSPTGSIVSKSYKHKKRSSSVSHRSSPKKSKRRKRFPSPTLRSPSPKSYKPKKRSSESDRYPKVWKRR